MTRAIGWLGRGFLALAGVAFLVGASLFVLGAYLVTWPILRLPARERRISAAMNVGSALVGAAIALRDAPSAGPPQARDAGEQTSPAGSPATIEDLSGLVR